MSSGRGRGGWGWGLCAAGLVIGCGGTVRYVPDESAQGGSRAEQGGASATDSGGSFGADVGSFPGSAGSSGAGGGAGAHAGGSGSTASGSDLGEGGFAGLPDEAGAPGDPIDSCTPVGVAVDITIVDNQTFPACRGNVVNVPIQAGGLSYSQFTCCGVSNTAPQYAVPLGGQLGSDLGGELVFVVPAGAPLGKQILRGTCYIGGSIANVIALDVHDKPTVNAIGGLIDASNDLIVKGPGLNGLIGTAKPVAGGPIHECMLVQQDPGMATCRFLDIVPGSYAFFVSNAGCGTDVGLPFTVLDGPTL